MKYNSVVYCFRQDRWRRNRDAMDDRRMITVFDNGIWHCNIKLNKKKIKIVLGFEFHAHY